MRLSTMYCRLFAATSSRSYLQAKQTSGKSSNGSLAIVIDYADDVLNGQKLTC